jgi:hypothetical protein
MRTFASLVTWPAPVARVDNLWQLQLSSEVLRDLLVAKAARHGRTGLQRGGIDENKCNPYNSFWVSFTSLFPPPPPKKGALRKSALTGRRTQRPKITDCTTNETHDDRGHEKPSPHDFGMPGTQHFSKKPPRSQTFHDDQDQESNNPKKFHTIPSTTGCLHGRVPRPIFFRIHHDQQDVFPQQSFVIPFTWHFFLCLLNLV